MRRFIETTWLPTLVFAVLSGLDPWLEYEPIVYLAPTLTALLIVPPIWRGFVFRQGRPNVGRASLAGATTAFLILMVPMVILSLQFHARHEHSEGFGDFLLLFWVAGSVLIGAPVGAGIAALVARVQRQWERDAPAEAEDPTRDGAWGGAMVAILASPLEGLLGGILLQPFHHLQADIGILLFWTWLVMVPAGAAIGALGAKRWKRIARRSATAARLHPPRRTGSMPASR